MPLRHVVEAQQFSRGFLDDELFPAVNAMRDRVRRRDPDLLRCLTGRVMVTLFYEPSTRTRHSFESAMLRLGGSAISTENALDFSSAVKGETLADTVRVEACYADVIVLRHFDRWSAKIAAAYSPVPVINGGAGPGQHPTQALLDVYTIQDEIGRLDNIAIAMVGDLANGRTARSLCYLLAKYEYPRIFFVSPARMRMRKDVRRYLQRRGVRFEECDDIREVAGRVDVIYMTRVQQERMRGKPVRLNGRFVMDASVLKLMRQDARIMHPLPRTGEIKNRGRVDADLRAAYFRQVHNGLCVRMALLKMILAPDAPL
ncbi:MAG: aspartate carbamoyltransferase [Parcubacteria group bacterium]|nr:aspartate carbamoyltransferase [Parcubacteria group bacterium]